MLGRGAKNDDGAGRRIRHWLRGFIERCSVAAQRPVESPGGPQWGGPRLTLLEPRIVLSATAELSAASGLLIFGDFADDEIHFQTVGSGDSIQLTDAFGTVIPIAGHHGGATGSETDPLAVSQISNGQVTIDLGGGDDLLQIELPDGINLDVIDAAGADRTVLGFQPVASPAPPTEINIVGETIELTPSGTSIQFADRIVSLTGGVILGAALPTGLTQIDLGAGVFEVEGTVTLDGSVRVIGDSGEVLWQDATVSASSGDLSLFFEFDPDANSLIRVGQVDASAGEWIEDVRVVSATETTFAGDVTIQNTLSIDSRDQVDLQGDVTAGNLGIRSGEIVAAGNIATDSGALVLIAGDRLAIDGRVDGSAAGTAGNVTLSAPNVFLTDASITTDGANVLVSGNSRIAGQVVLNTALGLTVSGGDVVWIGPITSDDSMPAGTRAAGELTIDAIGASAGGRVEIRGNIGGTSVGGPDNLARFAVAAGDLAVRDVSVDGGDVVLAGDQIRLAGATIRSSDSSSNAGGNIQLSGDVVFERTMTEFNAAQQLTLDGNHRTLGPNDSVMVLSGNSVMIRGEFQGGDQLSIDASGSIVVDADLIDWNGIRMSADGAIQVAGAASSSRQISATGSVLFLNAVTFAADTELQAMHVRFDDAVSVQASRIVELSAVMIDSQGQTAIEKQGDGELVLLAENASSTDLVIVDGILRVDGSIDAAAVVEIRDGAVLAGSGEIRGTVTVAGGTLAPDEFFSGSPTGQLRVGTLSLTAGATFQVDVDGATVGQSLDSVAIDGQPIEIDGAALQLDVAVTLPGDTELVIVQNDSDGPVTGRFVSNVDENGQPLATPRELFDGARVLTRFGPGAAAVPAFITYFGGDGNDVAIVTAGDRLQPAGKVTIVSRAGVDLEIRSGDSLADAQTADPTVRPIAGLNGRMLVLDATAEQAALLIDIDGFVDVGANPLHFDVDIVFDTAQVPGDASVTIFDSDRSTLDSPEQFDFIYHNADELGLTVQHDPSRAPAYEITMVGVRLVDLQLPSAVLSGQLTPAADQLDVIADADSTMTQWKLFSGGLSGELRFENPTDSLSIDGRDGNDRLSFAGFGQDFDAVPTVVGGQGVDEVNWNADIDVGMLHVASTFLLDAESVTIDGDLTLIGGDIRIHAGDELVVRSTVDANTGQIIIDSTASLSDLSLGTLRSNAAGVAVSLHGGDFLLGNIFTSTGTLVLGSDDGFGTIGSVGQVTGSQIDAIQVTSSSTGQLDLGSTNNTIDNVHVAAEQGVLVRDSADDLRLFVSATATIDVQVAGDLVLESAVTTNGSIKLIAAGNIVAEAGQPDVNVGGDVVEMTAGGIFPGQSNVPGTMASIGSASVPIQVSALQSFSASTSATGGSIFVNGSGVSGVIASTGMLPIGLVDAGNGRIEIDAVVIDDADLDSTVDLIGREIRLGARSGIGAGGTITVTGVADVQAVTDLGAIRMDVLADRTVKLSRVRTGGGNGEEILIRHSGDDRLSILDVGNANGDVTLLTETASMDVLSEASPTALSAGGIGTIVLQNLGGQSDITVRGGIVSDSGDVTIAARRNLVVTPSGHLTSLDGSVFLSGGNAPDLPASTVALQDGSVIDAGAGTVVIQTPGNVFVSSIRSTHRGQAISIESQFGSLIDAGDQAVDLVAESGLVRLDVAGGVGDGDAIETEIAALAASVRQTGTLQISEGSAIELVDVLTADGKIEIVAVGNIVAERVRSQNASGQDADQHRDVRLVATAADSDILVRSIVTDFAESTGQVTDVELVAGDDVLSFGADSLLIADDLRVASGNATDDAAVAIRLLTNVNDLELSVLGTARGDVQIDEADSIRLASSDRQDDGESVSTVNGEIRVRAAESIVVFDSFRVDDLNSRRGDVELIAGGANGRIRLQAGQLIQLDDSVQIRARQSVEGAVTIDAPQIVLGKDFQIETGDGVGVARRFATRPDDGQSDTAFYDATTIATNRLEQAAVNDATGILTVDIGNPGERGLTINIDWGAATQRFQQIDSLSGDAAPLQVEHLYLEPDILDARFNGRTSATDPLEVRFSVRHHESIVVTGTTIQQADSVVHVVEGELISSTDNPLTEDAPSVPILENGAARFIIPSLSIPVAFFPVRDVIPVIEQAPVFVSNETSVVVLGGAMETTEVVASTTTTREEFFQIRVLSPDPEGDDLVPPTRLPDDIISGDQLKKLFQSLPDGRYQIQYVLGDGNVRSILSVDLRNGKPVLPGDSPDGGALRLVPVDPDAQLDIQDANDPDADDSDAADQIDAVEGLDRSSHWAPPMRLDRSLDVRGPDAWEPPRLSRFSVAGRFRARVDGLNAADGREESE
ncbi:hypothetical protein NZK35_11455 [Stieleria sp. ICT_E10.1]|uniref:beta strand repeat-containing protein n=1 Tax=Stieleria sedimenti TaxID=2976331 RepID=UPI00217F873F|nr:hypothetical protein [Stieleria sedimenti]MCS7467259.1 hypothetical protein [Stieleria sedimenti]